MRRKSCDGGHGRLMRDSAIHKPGIYEDIEVGWDSGISPSKRDRLLKGRTAFPGMH